MEAKEKSKELVNKFMDYASSETMTKHHDENRQLSNAKECALIVVNELIKATKGFIYDNDFWEEVKKEIEKL